MYAAGKCAPLLLVLLCSAIPTRTVLSSALPSSPLRLATNLRPLASQGPDPDPDPNPNPDRSPNRNRNRNPDPNPGPGSDSRGAEALRLALESNTSLTRLSMRYNHLDDESQRAVRSVATPGLELLI